MDGFPVLVSLQVVDGDIHQTDPCLFRRPCDMGSEMAILGCQQRIVCRWRFCGEDIDSGGGEAAGVQGIGNSLLVNQRASARIDQDGGRLHPFQRFRIDKSFSGGCQRTMQRQDIALSEQCFFLHRRDEIRQLFLFLGSGSNHLHPERMCDVGDRHADVP